MFTNKILFSALIWREFWWFQKLFEASCKHNIKLIRKKVDKCVEVIMQLNFCKHRTHTICYLWSVWKSLIKFQRSFNYRIYEKRLSLKVSSINCEEFICHAKIYRLNHTDDRRELKKTAKTDCKIGRVTKLFNKEWKITLEENWNRLRYVYLNLISTEFVNISRKDDDYYHLTKEVNILIPYFQPYNLFLSNSS